MKKIDEIFINGGFYCKNSQFDDDFLKSYFEKFKNLPCSREVNGFYLVPAFAHPFKIDDFTCVWYTIPYNSPTPFFFTCLKDAESFARHYKNNHKSSYWNKLYDPVYSFLFCSKYAHF